MSSGKNSVHVTAKSVVLPPSVGLFLGGWKSSTKHSIKGLGFSLADSSLLQDNVAFVLCLDTLGQGNSLHLHVSKPPKEGTLQHAFLRELEMVTKMVGWMGTWGLSSGSCSSLARGRRGGRHEERVYH